MIDVIRADITTLKVHAIVNAASEAFRGGGGVDGAIHRAAGPELLEECRRHARLPTGEAIRTAGYRLAARWVIHTVGPVWQGGHRGEPELLRRAYQSVFRIARETAGLSSLAFPAISTGVYGYPVRDAALIALHVMRANEMDFERVVACVFGADDEALYRELLAAPAAEVTI